MLYLKELYIASVPQNLYNSQHDQQCYVVVELNVFIYNLNVVFIFSFNIPDARKR